MCMWAGARPSSQAKRAAQRAPLPHMPAGVPSGLTKTMRKSAAGVVGGRMRMRPSQAMPVWGVQRRAMAGASRSGKTEASSRMTMKSLPAPCILRKGMGGRCMGKGLPRRGGLSSASVEPGPAGPGAGPRGGSGGGGEDLEEEGEGGGPVGEEAVGEGGGGGGKMGAEEAEEGRFFGSAGEDGVEVDGVEVAAEVEVAVEVEDVGGAARHAGAEVDAGRTQDQGFAARHVFEGVVANAFGHQGRAGVADAEAFAGAAVEVDGAARGAVGDDVAGDGVGFGGVGGAGRRRDGDGAAGKGFAQVVVGGAAEVEGDAVRKEGAEGLAGGAFEVDGDGAVGETGGAEAGGDFAGEGGADGAVGVGDGAGEME